jgi:glycosyltransferase involved in cell wall biosynthesis
MIQVMLKALQGMEKVKDNPVHRPGLLVLTSTFPRWENDPEPAFVFELSRRLGADFDVTVLAPRSPGSKMRETMAGLHVIRFPYFFRHWENLATHSGGILNRLRANPFNYLLVPLFLLGQLLALVRLMRQERFALIHAHWLIPQGLIAVMGLTLARLRIPLVCTSHGGDLFALRGTIFKRLKRWVIDRCQALTVVSRAMQNTVVDMGVAPDKVQVISMGVDLQHRFTPDYTVERSTSELLFVGRLVEKKGLRVLLEAMPKVLATHPGMRLTVAGAGPLDVELRELSRSLGISSNVDFLGMVTQSGLSVLYRRATLAVFPFLVAKSGDQEGFGLVQVEAMGCGCPVIAGDLPSIHDSITHEENGLLVSPGNPELLADTILRALNDPDLCFRLAREARKKVLEQFDWEVVAEKYVGLYDRL